MKKILALILLCGMFYVSGISADAECIQCGETYEMAPALLDNLKELDNQLQADGMEEMQPAVFRLDSEKPGLGGYGITPSKGDINSLIIMVEFADVKFAEDFTEEYVENLLFAPQDVTSDYYPMESMNAWYQRSSFGQLSFHGEVEKITLENTREYYTYDAETNPEGEMKCREDIMSAVRSMDKEWSEYDSDGDCYVDFCCFIMAGEAGNWAEQWWSHVFQGNVTEIDDTYHIGNLMECMESQLRDNAAFTAIHEMGHSLGLPDLYNTKNGGLSGGIHTTDIMATNYGEINALCKMLLGWIEPDRIQMVEYGSDLTTVILESYPGKGDCALLFVDDTEMSLFGEYYLVQYMDFAENTQSLQWAMEKEHLQIYHVNAELAEDGREFLYNNNQECKLIEAVDQDVECEHGTRYSSWWYEAPVWLATFEDAYGCGYLPGDELTPYSAPSSGKYATDGLNESPDEFSGLNITNIFIEEGEASFNVFYETEPSEFEAVQLQLRKKEERQNGGIQAQLVSNYDIWLHDDTLKSYIREKDTQKTVAEVEVNMENPFPYSVGECPAHNTFRIIVDSSVEIQKGIDYELVFPAGMFVTSFGMVSDEIVLSKEEETGVSVSGAILSYGEATAPITVRLLQGTDEIAKLETADGSYQFATVEDGIYTLEISKENHVTRICEITVEESDVLFDVKIILIGDVSGDGKLNALDQKKLYNHIAKKTLLTEYDFAVGDVNEDGKINALDQKIVYNHIAKKKLLW